jgi:predicted RNase H-like HicB family nuclease
MLYLKSGRTEIMPCFLKPQIKTQTMARKKVTAVIEASSTGFGVYADRLPGITGYGNTVEKAKKDFLSAIQETKDAYGDKVPAFLKGEFEFEYKYDIGSIFDYFGVLDAGQLAKKIGMNASLLRQYKSGHAKASDKQKEKIEAGLHALGRELLSVRL